VAGLEVALKTAGLQIPTDQEETTRAAAGGRVRAMAWVVTLTYDARPDEDEIVEWGERLAAHDGSVAGIPERGVDLTLWVEAPDPIKAASRAHQLSRAVVRRDPIGIEILTEREHQRRGDEPTLPELVTAPEVGEILGGISRQRVYQLQHVAGFPEPLYRLRTGAVWDRRAIEMFARSWKRRPGRPKVTASV
jgi:hypothetical protein